MKDIEQRAVQYARTIDNDVELLTPNEINRIKEAYYFAATEERERGKRFIPWAFDNDYSYYIDRKEWRTAHGRPIQYDELFSQFLSEEKTQSKPSVSVVIDTKNETMVDMENNAFEDLIQTIERNAVDNKSTISDVKLWAKSWREEMKPIN